MTIQMKELPYHIGALEPIISARTMELHHGKHYATYVKNTNDLIAGTPLEDKDLDYIVRFAAGKPEYQSLFNNAAQAFNHAFFWNSLTPLPQKRALPNGIADKITQDFGSLEAFKEAFQKAAVSQFGSGWAWLIAQEGTLKIVTTSNAHLPLGQGIKPLLNLDVWEHAYYLDYQNKRTDFAKQVIDGLLNWQFAWDNYHA